MDLSELFRRLSFLLRKDTLERELQEEMDLHRELRTRLLAEEGSPDAREHAARLFGNNTLLKERATEMWGWTWFEDFLRDLRHTARVLRLNPAFTITVIAILALGIGANTAIFSALNALLLRGLPLRDPEQIVRLTCDGQPDGASDTGNPRTSFSYYVFQHLRDSNGGTMSDVVAYVPASFNKISVRTSRIPEEASVLLVSGNFFSGLRVRPECGRLISSADERTQSDVAVLSYAYAASHFGNACAAVGRKIAVKGSPFTISGVTAPEFHGVESEPTEIWIPFQRRPEFNAWGVSNKMFQADPTWWCIRLIGHLRPGVRPTEAERILNQMFQRFAYETASKTPGEKMTRLHLQPARGIPDSSTLRCPLLMLQVMVGFLLLIACANVSMLLAVRNAARGREFSIRLALGGSRSRLVRQLVAESSALLFAATLAGLFLAEIGARILARWAALNVSLAPDRTVSLFAIGISCLVGFVFGIAPALSASKISILSALKTTAATAFRNPSRVRSGSALATLQIALCLALLSGTGLLLRTLRNLENVDVGFKPARLLVFGITPNLQSESEQIAFFRALTDRLRSIPLVEAVTLTGNRIGSNWTNNTIPFVDGRVPQDSSTGTNRFLRWNNVGPDFFGTLGIRMIAGRDFNDADSADAPAVAVVNQTFAEKFFRGRNALGHTVSYSGSKPFTIVGVAQNSVYADLTEEKLAMAWFPFSQSEFSGEMHVEMRIQGDPMALLPRIREVVSKFAPDLALLEPRTQKAEFDRTITTQRLLAQLSASFAVLAAVLIAAGLYGTTSYQVARRTSELGVRMALGAERGQVMWMIFRGVLMIAGAGSLVGLALTIVCSRFLSSLLFDVQPNDPVSLAAAILGILLLTALAAFGPARRAAAVDPLLALRQE